MRNITLCALMLFTVSFAYGLNYYPNTIIMNMASNVTNATEVFINGTDIYNIFFRLDGTNAPITGNFSIGEEDAGHNFTAWGSSDSGLLLWDSSANTLDLQDAILRIGSSGGIGSVQSRLKFGADENVQIYRDASDGLLLTSVAGIYPTTVYMKSNLLYLNSDNYIFGGDANTMDIQTDADDADTGVLNIYADVVNIDESAGGAAGMDVTVEGSVSVVDQLSNNDLEGGTSDLNINYDGVGDVVIGANAWRNVGENDNPSLEIHGNESGADYYFEQYVDQYRQARFGGTINKYIYDKNMGFASDLRIEVGSGTRGIMVFETTGTDKFGIGTGGTGAGVTAGIVHGWVFGQSNDIIFHDWGLPAAEPHPAMWLASSDRQSDEFLKFTYDTINQLQNNLTVNASVLVLHNLTGNYIIGELWNRSSSTAPWTYSIAASGIYYNMTGLEEGPKINGFSTTHATQALGGSYMTAEVPGTYKVDATISFEVSVSGGLYGVAISHNFERANHNNCYARREASGQVGNVGITCFMQVAEGDTINMQVEDETAPARDILIHNVNFNLMRVGD